MGLQRVGHDRATDALWGVSEASLRCSWDGGPGWKHSGRGAGPGPPASCEKVTGRLGKQEAASVLGKGENWPEAGSAGEAQ